jgi:hypothetical protein
VRQDEETSRSDPPYIDRTDIGRGRPGS